MEAVKALLRPWIPEERRAFLRELPSRLRSGWRILSRLRLARRPIRDLEPFECRVRSQNGEDGVLAAIFARVGTTNRYFVEFGVEDGKVCNSRRLLELGWTGLQMDGRPDNAPIKTEFVTAEAINGLFAKYGVPKSFDLLSVDIDGNDYWVWRSLEGWRPRVVVVEYNATIPPSESRVIAYDPDFRWDGTDYYGASLRALQKLGASKGYTLVGCESRGVNAFFVADELVPGNFEPPTLEAAFRELGPPHRAPRHAPGRAWTQV